MATSLTSDDRSVPAKYLSLNASSSGATSYPFNMLGTSDNDSLLAGPTSPPYGPLPADFDMVRHLKFYALAIIIPVGIITNILSIFVFFRSFMRRSSTGHYLISLAFADMSLLVGEFLSWLNSKDSQGAMLGIGFMNTVDFWCKFVQYLRYAGRIWSSWLTVIITMERFIIVAFPLKVFRISTATKAKIVIVIELIIAFSITSFPLFTLGIIPHKGRETCQIIPPNTTYEQWMWVVIRGGELVCPSLIVCVFTSLIIFKLAKASKNRHKQLEGQVNKGKSRGSSHERQLTIILVAVAITFVVIRLPYTITFYVNEYKEEVWVPLDKWFSFKIYVINSIAQVLAVVNYAINFFLYCMCGSTFRRELWKAFGCSHKNGQRNHTSITTAASPSPSRKGETKL